MLNENTANVQQLSNLNTQIKEIDDAITKAGYHIDKTTGKIVELEAAENNIKLNDDLTNAQNKVKVLEKEDSNISSLIDRYNQLSSTQNKSKTQQDELNSVVQQLQGSILGVNVVTDANGNKTIKNIDIITDKKKAIEDEKNAAITAANAEQQAVERNTQVTIDGVNLTIAALKKKVEAYKLAINAYKAEMAASMSNNYMSNYIDKQTLEAYENYDKYKGVLDGIESSFDNLNASYSGTSSGSGSSYEPSGSSDSSSKSKSANDALERAHNLEKQHSDDIVARYQKQLDQLKQKNELTDRTNQLLKDQNDLLKAQQDLENAQKQHNVYMYINDKVGWQWVADQEAVKAAQETLKNAQEAYNKEKADQELKAQEDRLEVLIKAEQDAQSARDRIYENKKGGYASGTDYATPGIHSVSEDGIELVIGNQLKNFQGGETVMQNNLTKNLIDWGKISPNRLFSNIVIPSIKIPNVNSKNVSGGSVHNSIKIEHIELPNVNDGDQFINEMIQIANTSY